jgi:hypothetical protein
VRYALSPYIKQIRFVFKGLTCTRYNITLAGTRPGTNSGPPSAYRRLFYKVGMPKLIIFKIIVGFIKDGGSVAQKEIIAM